MPYHLVFILLPQLFNALSDIVNCPVRIFLLVEQVRVHGVDHQLETTHIQDAVVEELVQTGHVVEHEQFVLMH